MTRNASKISLFRSLFALTCAGCLALPLAAEKGPAERAPGTSAGPLKEERLAETSADRARVRRAAEPSLAAVSGDAWLRELGFTVLDAPGDGAAPLKSAAAGWELLWDVDTDLPHLLQGPGIDLGTLAGPGPGGGPWTRAELEPRLRRFLEAVPQLGWWRGEEMRWSPRRSHRVDGAWLVELGQVRRGIPVEGARAVFRIVSGRIVQFGTAGLAPVRRSTVPGLDWARARGAASVALGLDADSLPPEAELVLVRAAVEDPSTAHRGHLLLWRAVFHSPRDRETYRLSVNADDGSIFDLDSVRLDGEVWGDVHRVGEVSAKPTPLPWLEVSNQGTRITDGDGRYDDVPGTSTAGLTGPRAAVRDLCGPIELSSSDGRLDFVGAVGTDCTTPGVGGDGNTQAARDVYYHLARGAEDVLLHQPSATEFLPITAFTNDPDTPCSASWNPAAEALLFGQSSDECRSPGEIPGLIAHEWGHALDSGFGGLSSYGAGIEAAADVVALLYTEDGCVARGLRPGIPCHNCSPTCSGVRDLDRWSAALGTPARPGALADPAEVACRRFGCPFADDPARTGPLGYQAHCESYLASTAIRDLIALQAEVVGEEQAWDDVRRLWYRGMPALGDPYRRVPQAPLCSESLEAVDGCALDSWYHVLLAVDDDDGDLTNGTPNACRIWEALAQHGLACGESKDCTCVAGTATADAGPDRTICSGESAVLGTPGLGDTTYAWEPTGDRTAQIEVSPLETTHYWLHASNSCGHSSDRVTVTVRDCVLDGSFDRGGADWYRDGAWRPVASPVCAPPHPGSSPAMYFGHLATCQLGDGATTALGDLISPPITLDSAPAALEFSYYLQVDDPRPERDRAELAISVAGGPWQPRWSASSDDPLPAEWLVSPSLSLAPYAGQDIRLRFRFDSVDPEHNGGYGWLVDEVRLVDIAAPGPNAAPEIVRVESPPEVQSECACVSCLFGAIDAEDGDLSDLLSWHSSLDGALGVGTRLHTILSPGVHVITVSVTDHGGATAAETLTLTITADAESCQLDEWPPAEPRLYCGDDEDEDP